MRAGGLRIWLGFGGKVANVYNHPPTIYGVLLCRWLFQNCKGCTAQLAGHTTFKPNKFFDISLGYVSEDVVFLSMVLIGALSLRLVPLTKLDESFTDLSAHRGGFE